VGSEMCIRDRFLPLTSLEFKHQSNTFSGLQP
jgi:hypothetical protein